MKKELTSDEILDILNQIRKEKAILFNNLAMCHLNREEVKEANYYNKRCLELDPGYMKANYRRV